MTGLDLRPLALGEILDRTFSLYRQHFLLFVGIALIPQILVLAISLALTLAPVSEPLAEPSVFLALAAVLFMLAVTVMAYLFSQGGAIFAVSDLYLGRSASLIDCLKRAWSQILSLFGVVILNGLTIMIGLIFFIIPGIYWACRQLVCIPAALVERRTPGDALSRSSELTHGYRWRAFVILVLTTVLSYGAQFLVAFILGAIGLMEGGRYVGRTAEVVGDISSTLAGVLVTPVLLIASAVYYYDLRVRKEAFDLQFMMDPDAILPTRPTGVTSILS